jgi:hypothetical protein
MGADSRSPFDEIAACHPKLLEAALLETQSWLPDAVPATLGLGALGSTLVQAERELDDATLERIASLVEGFLRGGGGDADAVATGFLEAICNRSDASAQSVERIVGRLGIEAVGYIRAWDAYTGVKTRGLP